MSLPPASKPPSVAIEEGGRSVLRFLPRLITILDNLQRLSHTVEKQAAEIEGLRARVTTLEARKAMLLAKIEAAATKSAADMASRLGRLEGIQEARDRRD